MDKTKIKKPFFLTKEYWSTKGTEKQKAEAKYKLSGEELERKLVDIEYEDDNADKKVKLLEIDRKYGKLTDIEFKKQSATAKNEPYVGVLETHFDPTKPKNGFFELDWNDKFIENLQTNGYHGENDEEVVNKWFNDLCKNIMLEDMDQDVVAELQSNIKESKKDLGDGKVEYS
tara:strand:- start:441 stop:959 length:519 start_codon:yes stop_codon:yes gene_type:complete